MSISRRSIASTLSVAFSPDAMAPPVGDTPIRAFGWMLPDRIGPTPAVYVFPPEEDLSYPPSMRASLMDWRVRLYLYKVADTARQTDLLYRWMDVLAVQLDDRVHLTLSDSVLVADVVGMKGGSLTYADELFDGVEVAIRVNAQESVTFTG